MSKNRRKPSFKEQWGNLTEIGRLFDLSAVSVGKKLKEFGLRNPDGTPSEEAMKTGMAMTQILKSGITVCWWSKQQLPNYLDTCGLSNGLSNGLSKTTAQPGKAFDLALRLRKLLQEGRRLSEDGDPAEKFFWDAVSMEIEDSLKNYPTEQRLTMEAKVAKEMEKLHMTRDDITSVFPHLENEDTTPASFTR